MNPATWSHLSGLCALTDEIQLAIYEHENFQLYVDVMCIIPILNLKGGGNEDKNRHDIPYLTNMKFAWNGLPMIDFIEKILYPLNVISMCVCRWLSDVCARVVSDRRVLRMVNGCAMLSVSAASLLQMVAGLVSPVWQ